MHYVILTHLGLWCLFLQNLSKFRISAVQYFYPSKTCAVSNLFTPLYTFFKLFEICSKPFNGILSICQVCYELGHYRTRQSCGILQSTMLKGPGQEWPAPHLSHCKFRPRQQILQGPRWPFMRPIGLIYFNLWPIILHLLKLGPNGLFTGHHVLADPLGTLHESSKLTNIHYAVLTHSSMCRFRPHFGYCRIHQGGRIVQESIFTYSEHVALIIPIWPMPVERWKICSTQFWRLSEG